MKVHISEFERWPCFAISQNDMAPTLQYNFIEISPETFKDWNTAIEEYNRVQKEMMTALSEAERKSS